MNLREASEADGYLAAARIESGDVRLLWHNDFWDGPRSGMLRYLGEECWFKVVAEDLEPAAPWYRRFTVVRLTPSQHAEQVRWHELFREHVGGHTDYDETGRRLIGTTKPQAQWANYYDAVRSRTKLDLSDNEIIGWFEH